MKKIFFVLPLLVFLLNPFYSEAQAPKAIRRNIIKTSPLAMLQGPILGFSEYRLQYERALTPSHAILISGSYLGKGIFSDAFYSNFSFSNPYATTQYNGYRGMLGYKFYVNAYAPTGFYLMPLASYSYGKIYSTYDPTSDYITATYLNITGNVGYQLLIAQRVSMDFFVGIGWKNNVWAGYGQYYKDPDLPVQGTAAKVTLGMNFGIAF